MASRVHINPYLDVGDLPTHAASIDRKVYLFDVIQADIIILGSHIMDMAYWMQRAEDSLDSTRRKDQHIYVHMAEFPSRNELPQSGVKIISVGQFDKKTPLSYVVTVMIMTEGNERPVEIFEQSRLESNKKAAAVDAFYKVRARYDAMKTKLNMLGSAQSGASEN